MKKRRPIKNNLLKKDKKEKKKSIQNFIRIKEGGRFASWQELKEAVKKGA